MKSPSGHDDHGHGGYRIASHHPPAKARHSRWGIWSASLFGVAGAVALITLTGTGGATADVPMSLQVGSQATTSTVATTVPTTTSPTNQPTTTLLASTTLPATTAPTTVPPTTTTTPTTPITIVIPQSKVSENDSGTSDDASERAGIKKKGVDN